VQQVNLSCAYQRVGYLLHRQARRLKSGYFAKLRKTLQRLLKSSRQCFVCPCVCLGFLLTLSPIKPISSIPISNAYSCFFSQICRCIDQRQPRLAALQPVHLSGISLRFIALSRWVDLRRKRSIVRLCTLEHHQIARRQLIQMIGIPLHHGRALLKVLRLVVDA
jgi:hypothetical protein